MVPTIRRNTRGEAYLLENLPTMKNHTYLRRELPTAMPTYGETLPKTKDLPTVKSGEAYYTYGEANLW